MNNTRKQNKTNKAVKAAPSFKAGSARVKISDSLFGERFLGGEDFCVFHSETDARNEVSTLIANGNSNVISEWEIHTFLSGAWHTTGAGVNPALVQEAA
jgi:hypothetical protein